MKRPLLITSVFLLLIATLLGACATTQPDAIWKDPSYDSYPHKILVLGVAKTPINRRIFEDEFVRKLNAWGTDAVASYTVLPDKEENEREVIARKMRELGADTVLITRLVSKKTVQVYLPGMVYYPPPFYGTWPDYYGYGYRAMATPGYWTDNEYAMIETNLYDANNERLIWAATTEIGLFGSKQEIINSYISITVKAMASQGLLGK